MNLADGFIELKSPLPFFSIIAGDAISLKNNPKLLEVLAIGNPTNPVILAVDPPASDAPPPPLIKVLFSDIQSIQHHQKEIEWFSRVRDELIKKIGSDWLKDAQRPDAVVTRLTRSQNPPPKEKENVEAESTVFENKRIKELEEKLAKVKKAEASLKGAASKNATAMKALREDQNKLAMKFESIKPKKGHISKKLRPLTKKPRGKTNKKKKGEKDDEEVEEVEDEEEESDEDESDSDESLSEEDEEIDEESGDDDDEESNDESEERKLAPMKGRKPAKKRHSSTKLRERPKKKAKIEKLFHFIEEMMEDSGDEKKIAKKAKKATHGKQPHKKK